jgi:hypothetical protein
MNEPPHAASLENHSASSLSMEQLLVQAELISQEQLDTSLELSQKMRTPLERILSMQNYLSLDLFAKALEVQRLIQTRRIGLSSGLVALRSIKFENSSLEEALAKHKEILPELQPLGQTLLSIGAITDRQLQSAQMASSHCLLPLGWVLAARGIINQGLYASALTAQNLLQRNLLPEEQVLYYARLARLQQKDLRTLLVEAGIDTEAIDRELAISLLLISSGVLTKPEVLAYREFALLEDTELETILFNFNILDELALTAINDSYIAIVNNDLTIEQAAITLYKLNQVDWDLSRLEQDSNNNEESVALTDLIDSARLLTPKQLTTLMEESIKNRQPVYDVLIKQQLLDVPLLEGLEKSKQLIDLGLLGFRQAVLLLLYCAEHKCDLVTAFAQFGWNSWQFDT